ncbi:MAG TPA: DUF4214 domain-containing protein [Cellulomonas sp.]
MNATARNRPDRPRGRLRPGTRWAAGAAGAAVLALGLTLAITSGVQVAAAADASSSGTGTGTASDDSSTGSGGTTEVEQIPVVVPAVDDSGTPLTDDLDTEATATPTPSATAAEAEDVEVEVGDTVVADTAVDGTVQTEQVETDSFSMVGITWPLGSDVDDLDPEIRVRDDSGWSEWVAVEPADDDPDEGTVDAESSLRGGTEPLWVGDADAVQVRFGATTEGGPDDVRVELVSPGEVEADTSTTGDSSSDVSVAETSTSTSTSTSTEASTSSAVFTSTDDATVTPVATLATSTAAAPTIISRSSWGAPTSTVCGDVASSLVGAVIHHTASSNDYTTVAAAKKQILSFYTYHTASRGWCDIGYNFLVDKWGNVYEGRAGSSTSAVIGVHDGGFNTGTVGIAMIGTYTTAPSTATINAVAQVVAWRLSAYGVDPTGTMSYTTGAGENSRYKNQTVTLPRVFGHRDTAYTTCPGDGGYAALGQIRSTAKALMTEEYDSLVKALYTDLLGRSPDSSGLATWTGELSRGVSRSALVAALTASEEYLTLRITQTYQNILGRSPDAAGRGVWLRALQAGAVQVDDLGLNFLASEEMYLKGGGTDEGFVAAMYTQVLGRSASTSEQAYWAAKIRSGSRYTALSGIWIAWESAARRAAVYYTTFLGRTPDSGGLAHWTAILQSQGESAVRTGIAGSDEYYTRAKARF